MKSRHTLGYAMRTYRFAACCLALALILLLGGCSSYRQPPYPASWETEEVELGLPEAAYRAADGSIVVRYHIERELQPSYSGYHWLVIDPKAAEQALKPKAEFEDPSTYDYEQDHVKIRSRYSDPIHHPINAQMRPPILEPGLPDDRLPEGIADPVEPLVIVLIPHLYSDLPSLSLRKPEAPDIETRMIDLWPTIDRYQTAQGAENEQRYRKVSAPFQKMKHVVAMPFAFVIWETFELKMDKQKP